MHTSDEALGLLSFCEDGKIAKQGNRRRRSKVVGYARLQLDRDVDLPMHQDSATSLKPLMYEVIRGREMLQ